MFVTSCVIKQVRSSVLPESGLCSFPPRGPAFTSLFPGQLFLDKNVFIGSSSPVLALAAPGVLCVSGLKITRRLSKKSKNEGGNGSVLFKKSEKRILPGGLQLFRSYSEG